jgi:hypothetical protein
MREFLPSLTQELLDENRAWLEPTGLDPATGHIVFCFQSYVVKTPHHTVLVDACIGNDKNFAQRPAWHRKSDTSWMNALAAGVGVDDIDIVIAHLTAIMSAGTRGATTGAGSRPDARYPFSKGYEWDAVHRTPLSAMEDSVPPIIDAKKAGWSPATTLDDHIGCSTPGHGRPFAVGVGRKARA